MRTPSTDPPPSEITPEALYLRRRELMRNALLFGATATTVGGSLLWLVNGIRADPREAAESAAARRQRPLSRAREAQSRTPVRCALNPAARAAGATRQRGGSIPG